MTYVYSLLIQFARDLGPDFEPYFGPTLELLIELATDTSLPQQDYSVVLEWSFHCMAYLFKYLSRLLTEDLRPTYIAITPLMGKSSKQRDYVTRFAAESLSFLLRKCKGEALTDIMVKILEDSEETESEAFYTALTVLVSDSIKSTGNNLHSRATNILETLLNSTQTTKAADFTAGVIASVLHHARAETAKPVFDEVYKFIDDSSRCNKIVAMKIVFILAGLRKGSRVTDWCKLFEYSIKVLTGEDKASLIELASTLIISSDFTACTQYHQKLLKALDSTLDVSEFLVFARLVMDQNKEGFANFVMPKVKNIIQSQWENNEYVILLVLSDMHKRDLLSFDYSPGQMQLGQGSGLAQQSAKYLNSKNLDISNVDVQVQIWYSLELHRIAFQARDLKLLPLLEALRKVEKSPLVCSLIGKILSLNGDESGDLLIELIPELSKLRQSETFLKGYLNLITAAKNVSEENMKSIILEFVPCLNSVSHDVRYTTLEVISKAYKKAGKSIPKLVSQCSLIEQIPLDISNGRNLTMHIRNLGINFSTTPSDECLDNIIPRFIFGLLTVRFQPIWQAAFEALSKIGSGEKSMDLVWELAHDWIEPQDTDDRLSPLDAIPQEEFQRFSTLNCTNLNSEIKKTMEYLESFKDPENSLKLLIIGTIEAPEAPSFLRLHALQVLIKLPRLAERHGRILVPFFLKKEECTEDDDSSSSSEWSTKERMTLLELFTLFGNPKSLYQTEKVYERMLYLLGNRTVQVQKLALKCILTYKEPSIRKYADSLNNLLDETTFKDEITSLINNSTEDGEGTLHHDDRDAVLPLVIRILFGRSQMAKTGGGVKQSWRGAVVSSLNNVEPKFVRLFVSLATNRLDASGFLVQDDTDGSFGINIDHENLKSSELIRRELGFVTMLEKIVDILRAKVNVALDLIMEALVFSMYHAQAIESLDDENALVAKNSKSIRTLGFKCIDSLFTQVTEADWGPYFGVLFDHFISPKLDNFAGENLAQPSSLMKFFMTLTTRNDLVKYFGWGNMAIPDALFSCLHHDSVKDSVVDLCMSTMLNLFELESSGEIVDTCARMVLERMPVLFAREESSNELLDKESRVLVGLLTRTDFTLSLRRQLIQVSLSALEKSTAKIKVSVKVTIMQALSKLLVHKDTEDEEIEQVFLSLSPLFKQFSDRIARQNLALLYQSFGQKISKLSVVGDLIVELNAYSTRRVELLDFDRRLAAFAKINEELYSELSATEWLPLLYNVLFFIKDREELALRTNSTYSIKRYIDCFSSKTSQEAEPYIKLLQDVLLNAVRLGLREKSILFRQEFISILWYLVEKGQNYDGLDDLKCLLFEGDEEANFFYNITHVQQHRQLRAIRRLAQFAQQLQLKDTSIAHYLLPIIEHYVEDASGDTHNLSTESINTVGVLTRHLTWNQYRAITKRYISYLAKHDNMKVTIRLIDTVADSLSVPESGVKSGDEDDNEDDKNVMKIGGYGVKLSQNLPTTDRLSAFISQDIVPIMQKCLKSRKNEEDDDLTTRIPLAIPIVKFLKVLPSDLLEVKLPGVLTGFCQILRSKSQPLRDMIRKSLGKIGRILGARYVVFIIKELKGALRRGTQLHVLGYSVHSLLTEMRDILEHGDLDEPSEMISEIIMEDTFGVTASEKEAEDYTSKMKEVKQHKSFDTGQILAANVSLEVFGNIIEPVKSVLLYEKLTLNIERKVEELLRRVALGLTSNEEASDIAVLKMCHELHEMCQNVEAKEQAKRDRLTNESVQDAQKREQEEHFMVTLDSRYWGQKNTVHVKNLYIILKFIIEALRNVLLKTHALMTAENVSGFMPMLEESLQSGYEIVQIATLRLLTLIIKLPIPDMQGKLKMFGRQTVAIIKSCSNTNTELCQAALKFMAALVKLKSDFTMKDSAYAYLLERVKPDLEEPDRQGVTFTFVRAVLTRKIILPEVYDVMDMIAKVMVTNQTKTTRDTCRSVYFQFLTEYPQGEGRLNKQLAFLVNNLEYEAYEGRLSVMEMIHLLLTKIQNEQIESVTTSFFVALVLVLVNDDVSRCREYAAMLIEELLAIVNGKAEQQELVENYCMSWIANNDEALLLRGGLQVTGIYMKSISNPNKNLLQQAENKILDILEAARPDVEENVTWDVVYFALQLWDKFVEQYKSAKFTSEYQHLWDLIESSLLFPHSWVRSSAARLMGRLFKQCDSEGDKCSVNIEPLQSTAFKSIRQLGAPSIDQDLGIQIVKNLVFMTRRFEAESTIFKRPDLPSGTTGGKEEDGPVPADEQKEEDGEGEEEITATCWVVRKASYILRNEKRSSEMTVSKQSAIQYLASVIQVVSKTRLEELAFDLIWAFYPMSQTMDERYSNFKDLCSDALRMVQTKLGTTEYTATYSKVRQLVADRRVERKAKRAVQAVTEPELYARKKMKKNLSKREKRRHVKDENGYYHTKKKRA